MIPVVASYSIRSIKVAPGLVLAPMSGVTTSPFRRLIKELNPGAVGLVVSEFISVEGLTRASVRSRQMMRFREMERPYGIQIFGWDPERMKDAAAMVEEAGADLVDINCGCPAPKVVKRGGGCELMRQPEHLAKILNAVRRSVKIPLTLKMRSGWDETSRNAVEIARIAEQEGVEGLTVHGRTRSQLYRGLADWSVAQAVAAAVKIPVTGSGDVVDRTSALERLGGGVVGLFIGRAAMNNPFVFSDVLSGTTTNLRNDEGRILQVLTRYSELLVEEFIPQHCTGRMKQLVTQLCRGQPWRADLLRSVDFAAQLVVLAEARAALANGIPYRATHRETPPLHATEGSSAASELACDSFSSTDSESRGELS